MCKEIITRFGHRTYVFFSERNLLKAREIYAYHTGDLNEFETELERSGIGFKYELISFKYELF